MKKIEYILLCLLLLVCISWQEPSDLEKALSYSGDNRAELEKVLKHFQKDPNPLKFKSAVFLIENMSYFFSLYGDSVSQYVKIYPEAGAMPKELRDDLFKKSEGQIPLVGAQYKSDIRVMKADYLIHAIDQAVDVWKSKKWCNDYDQSIFLNYVLPYRISNEPLSDWRNTIANIYPYLTNNTLWSNRGFKLIAAENNFNQAQLLNEPSAIKGKALRISQEDSYVTFSLFSDIETEKLINFRYNTFGESTLADIYVNGNFVSKVSFEPTISEHNFRSSRYGTIIKIKKGINQVTLKYNNAPYVIDYIEVGSVFHYDEAVAEDFSNTLCTINNVQTNGFVSLDTLSSSLEKEIELKKYSVSDESLLLRLDYMGYPCWKISPKDGSDMCIENRWVSYEPKNMLGKYHYLRTNHQKWVLIPNSNGTYKIMNKETGMFWEAVIDTQNGKQFIQQNIENDKQSQQWIIKKSVNEPKRNQLFTIGNAASEALKVTDAMGQFEYTIYTGSLPPSLSDLCKFKYGTCREESSYIVALSRYLGIPTTTDFTPHWANRTGAHDWSVLILPNGKATTFYMGCAPGDTAQYYHSYLKPKVFRSNFEMNRKIVDDLKDETSVPELFLNPKFTDVTDEYCKTSDVTRTVMETHLPHKIAYICVFDTNDIIPVFYGKIKNKEVTFKSMGRNVAYMIAFLEGKTLVPTGNPFIIDNEGKVKEIECNYKKRISMKLLRKYPFFGKQDFFNIRMAYGKFQGSNNKNFDNANTFFQHEGITNGGWYEHLVNDNNSYRYLRYLGPNGSFCNINELEFFDKDGNKLNGKIIGTQGTPGQLKETVFDGNILTGFNGNSPDGHWVGLELDKPEQIGKIKYIPRNDGNCIEVGDKYQLNIYDHGMWRPLLQIVATENELNLQNIPSNGLYLLNDLTKGREERIFIYENGKQIWW